MKKSFEDICRVITEDEWQRARQRERRIKIITAVIIGIPCIALLSLCMAAANMWLIH